MIMLRIHALWSSAENWYLVTVFPGLSVMNSGQISLHAIFNGPKHPLSRGCDRWVVFGGNVNKMTLSLAANLMVSGQ